MAIRCPVCGEELASSSELERHDHRVPESTEQAGAGFTCPSCGAELDSEEGLVSHEAVVHAGWMRRPRDWGSRVRATAPRDHRPPRQWPQG